MKRKTKRVHIYYDMGVGVINKRLNSKTEGSELLLYTGLCKGRGYLKIETMLKGERSSVLNVFGPQGSVICTMYYYSKKTGRAMSHVHMHG